MSNKTVRVRFAPSPTGMMHLGNVRTALMNYLFAKHHNGELILRIEDTDPERNFDPGAKQIIADLQWLGLEYNYGPGKAGPDKPYFQSERLALYQEKLQELQNSNAVYPCFCTATELDKKRQRQIALKKPPRYDRTCLKLSEQERIEKMGYAPFIWRMKLDQSSSVTINDIAHGTITFDFQHFSDFPLSRQNGTFTFMFANFVDDMMMKMTHVLRGADHLSNTAGQVALYHAFNAPVPTYWHMPILCNIDGKKLSKRDFGFALKDLKEAGYLPEAIVNYLAIIGGGTFDNEIMSHQELAQKLDFKHAGAKGQIKYDVEKLRWLNHQWIVRTDAHHLASLCRPYLEQSFETAHTIDDAKLASLVDILRTDMVLLTDCIDVLSFYFIAPALTGTMLDQAVESKETQTTIIDILTQACANFTTPAGFVSSIKKQAREKNISIKQLFSMVRIALTGNIKGPGVGDLLTMLGKEIACARIERLASL